MPDAKWYVVHTYSGYENKVMSTLITTVENRGLQDMMAMFSLRWFTQMKPGM